MIVDRDKEIEKVIIKKFFCKNKRERAMYLIHHDSKIDTLFDALLLNYIDEGRMTFIVEDWKEEELIWKSIRQRIAGDQIYIFTKGICGLMKYSELCKIDMLSAFDEVIIYFGEGKGYYQGHFRFGSRERAYLEG